jgi:hypothetical protein
MGTGQTKHASSADPPRRCVARAVLAAKSGIAIPATWRRGCRLLVPHASRLRRPRDRARPFGAPVSCQFELGSYGRYPAVAKRAKKKQRDAPTADWSDGIPSSESCRWDLPKLLLDGRTDAEQRGGALIIGSWVLWRTLYRVEGHFK